jgi:1-phosphofructokinase
VILTLTPNPSLDRTIEVEAIQRGEVHRALSSRVDPGGKGVNVSRALAAHHISTIAVLPAGGAEGAQLAELLAPVGVPVITIPLSSPTRSNVTIVEPDGTTTKINEPGPVLSEHEIATMTERVTTFAGSASWVVLSGSLPRGVAASYFADLTTRIHEQGGRVAVDTSGAPLAEVVQAAPDLIKPNAEELAEISGRQLMTWGDVAEEAQRLRGLGIGAVLVSLGGDGALLVDADGVRQAWTDPVEVRSTVGAGDSTLTGFLASGADGTEALRTAVAFGAAAVTLPGSVMPGPSDVRTDQVHINESPDLDTPLKGDN